MAFVSKYLTLNDSSMADLVFGVSSIEAANYQSGTISSLSAEVFGDLNGFTVSSAGWVAVNNGAYASGGTVDSSGFLRANAGGNISGITVLAGGSIMIDGGVGSDVTIFGTWVRVKTGGQFVDLKVSNGGVVSVYDNGRIDGGAVYTGGTINVSSGTLAEKVVMNGGTVNVLAGGTATIAYNPWSKGTVTSNTGADVTYLDRDANVYYGGTTPGLVSRGDVLTDLTVETGNSAFVFESGLVDTATVNGSLYVSGGGFASSAVVLAGGSIRLQSDGAAGDIDVRGGYLMVDGGKVEGVSVSNTANARVRSNGEMIDLKVADGATVSAYDNAKVTGATVFEGGKLSAINSGVCQDITVAGGSFYIGANFAANGVDMTAGTITNKGTVSGGTIAGGTVNISSGALAEAVVMKGGTVNVLDGGSVRNCTLSSGGSMALAAGAVTGGTLTFDFTGVSGNLTALMNDMNLVTAGTTLTAKISEWGSINYVMAATSDTTKIITVTAGETTATLALNERITNPFAGVRYRWNGRLLYAETYSFTAAAATAAALSTEGGAVSLNGSDLAVKWTGNTTAVTGSVYLAANMTDGAAWLELAGYNGGTGTTLYGAQGDTFADGTVNINAKSGSLRNLAAGANAGGTVKAVNLTFAGAELDGTGYAGGFGNVTDEVNTTVTAGAFAKDFYAGALANKLTTATSVGNVSMTVAGGTFDGNIYGASAVKTDSTKGNGTRHTAGDVTLTVTGGSTTKGNQSCIFAGGYATGDATGTVYTVGSVTATISGGSWGEAAGGRGVFGGIMASGVTAQVIGNVTIAISGDATMGNVYGGGWAQKTNGKSTVGDVSINIEGGTIANVFGGGTHSTSGGTTETGDVTITVSGGNITGAIYARGQLEGDTTGAAQVIFTGSDGFDCDVYGYSCVGGDASDAALSFSSYTGTFSGAIGGFASIAIGGAAAMTLATAATDVSNGKWEFDFTERTDTLAGTSLLTWSGTDFENDTIKVSFADDTQAQGGWNIAAVAEAFSGTTFEVEIGGAEIATGLAYNQQIASGDYAGWGFELESGVLKFKQLA